MALNGRSLVFGLLFSLACGGAGGCRRSSIERVLIPPDFIKSEPVLIQLHKQATVHGFIRIGYAFVSEGDFTDIHGRSKKGLISGLYFYVRDDSSKDRAVKVHVGQRFEVAGYRFFVEAVQGGKWESIILRVLPPRT